MTAPGGWRRSSYCAAGDCIEIRESIHPGLLWLCVRVGSQSGRGEMAVSREDFAAFVAGVKAGEFDDLVTP